MVSHVHSLAFHGLDVEDVDVQVQVMRGIPAFHIVGLPDKIVAESKERIRSAFFSLALEFPQKRILVNLAPADLPKFGNHFDLPIALGLLSAMDLLSSECLGGYMIMGELGLDARLKKVRGVLPAAVRASEVNKGLICPAETAQEAALSGNLSILAVDNLLEVLKHFQDPYIPFVRLTDFSDHLSVAHIVDMSDIKGQSNAKFALEIAMSGGHHVLMSGPPGTGKSLLAAASRGITPYMLPSEALETAMIYSLTGNGDELSLLRPFRAPHHSASPAAVVGGGAQGVPGEISLAHNGVLFLDELPEFSHSILEGLRQPLETGDVSIARVHHRSVYPCRFQLIAAMNPCRCGYFGDPQSMCRKAPACSVDYLSKISGPIRDRIDLYFHVPSLDPMVIVSQESTEESSASIRKRVNETFQRQIERQNCFNARLQPKQIDSICVLDAGAREVLESFSKKSKLSNRAYHRTLKVARTVADMDGSSLIESRHLSVALSYRMEMGSATF